MAISPAIRLRPHDLFESSAAILEFAALFKSDRILVWRRSVRQRRPTLLSTQCIREGVASARVGCPLGRFALSASSKRKRPRTGEALAGKTANTEVLLQCVSGLIRQHRKDLSLRDRCGNKLRYLRRYRLPLYEPLMQPLPGFSRCWGE